MTIYTKALSYLRDPIWTFVAVVFAVLGLWVTTSPSPKRPATLSIYPFWRLAFEDYRLPSDKIRLMLKGSNQEIGGAVVDYYMVTNTSEKAVLASEITSPITVYRGPKTKKVLLVSSCFGYAGQPQGGETETRVSLNWTESADTWSAQPALLNPNDSSCVIIISQPVNGATPDALPSDRFRWEGRIVNVNVRVFGSAAEFMNSRPKDLSQYWDAEIKMSGVTPYWFAAIQLLLFIGTLTLARNAQWISSFGFNDILKVALLVAVATGTAESVTTVFSPLPLHPVVYAFFAGQLAIAMWLWRRGRRVAVSQQHSGSPVR